MNNCELRLAAPLLVAKLSSVLGSLRKESIRLVPLQSEGEMCPTLQVSSQ